MRPSLPQCGIQVRFTALRDNDGVHTPVLMACVLLLAGSAGAAVPVTGSSSERIAQRVLDLVNQARSQGRRCGAESFPPAAPLAAAGPLDAAASAHARDLAARNYFDHRGRDGREPRDRVRAAGYPARLTGENIAFGPDSAEEVVAGWLASAGHCANIMDNRFRHMGVAVATGQKAGHHYWVQVLAAPGG